MTSEHDPHTYKIIELVGSSPEGVEPAIENAIERASRTLHHLNWFEVREIRGQIEEGRVQWYQVKLGIGFRVQEDGEVSSE